jgi:hypothetical protein
MEGFEGLLRDKTRPSRIKPLRDDVAARIVALTLDERHRAQADETLSPVDEWSGRANEPDDQRGDHQGLPLSKPRKSEGSGPRVRDRLQLCKAICAVWTKDPEAFIISLRHLIPRPNS